MLEIHARRSNWRKPNPALGVPSGSEILLAENPIVELPAPFGCTTGNRLSRSHARRNATANRPSTRRRSALTGRSAQASASDRDRARLGTHVNPRWRHCALGYVSPNAFERAAAKATSGDARRTLGHVSHPRTPFAVFRRSASRMPGNTLWGVQRSRDNLITRCSAGGYNAGKHRNAEGCSATVASRDSRNLVLCAAELGQIWV